MTSLTSVPLKNTLVFVDSAVAAYQSLIDGVVPEAEAIALSPISDGIDQITNALADRREIHRLHIISHGEPGELHLGATRFNLDTLDRYSAHLTAWADSLADDAEIVLYGCRVAAGERGQQFIHRLHALTHADIAASATPTGSSTLGGDWNLEYRTGQAQPQLALQESTRDRYASVLSPVTPNLLYGVSNDGPSTQLVTIDTATGGETLVDTLSFDSFAIARDINTGRVYYIETGTASPDVAYWDPVTQENVTVGTTGTTGIQFLKLAQSQDGTLFALGRGSGTGAQIYTIDPATGTATARGFLAIGEGSGDATFDPVNPNRLIISVTRPGFYGIYAVDVSNPDVPGTPELLGNIQGSGGIDGGTGAGSLAFGLDGELYASSGSGLFLVDFTAAGLTASLVGPLSVNVSDFATLPINPANTIDVAVTKTDGRTEIVAGQTITYSITVSNPSGVTAEELQILDTIPPEITNVSWSASITSGIATFPSPADQQGTGNISARFNLGANSSVTYTVTGTVAAGTPAGTILDNTVTVQQSDFATPSQIFIDSNFANNTATDTTTVSAPTTTPLPPIAVDDQVSTSLNTSTNISVLLNDSDPNADPLAISGFTQPTNGSVSQNNNGTPANTTDDFLVYTPNNNFSGTDTFTYSITDGQGGFDTATVSVTVNNSVQPGAVDAIDDTISTETGEPVNIPVLNNDGPASERPLEIIGVTQPSNGIISINNNGTPANTDDDFIVYTPNPGFIGTDTFTYTIEGAVGGTDTAVITVNVSEDLPCGPGVNRVGNNRRNTLRGTIGTDDLRGRGGNDILQGLGCEDELLGQQGNDRLFGGDDEDDLRGNQGNDALRGGNADDVLGGGLGSDKMFGGNGDDSLRGGRANDRVDGGSGDDSVRGNLGNDVAFGRGGNDFIDTGNGNDRANGGPGSDIIYSKAGSDRVTAGTGEDFVRAGLGRDNVSAGKGSDVVFGGQGNDRILTQGGSDYADGGAGNDRVVGGVNIDELLGRQGEDNISGGSGNDLIRGGFAKDELSGDKGLDTISGGKASDTIYGWSGSDNIDAGQGRDTILAGTNDDTVQGRQGTDTIQAGGGDDFVRGGAGNDIINGGDGNDTLIGGLNSDQIDGGRGQDTIIGGFGADQLTGGLGRDSFVYESFSDRGDTITDFQVGRDVIDLSQIFQASQFASVNPFAQYVRLAQIGSSTVVRVDSNGDTPGRDFVDLVTLDNVAATSVTAQSFVV